MLKKILKMALVALALVFAGLQFVRPSRVNPPAKAGRGIEDHVRVTPAVGVILKRSCMDCHSNRTEWPWYSNVAPTSWLVADHVNQGRRHLNFSDWARMNRGEAGGMLKFICEEAQGGSMPMPSYTLVHRGAKLSDADIGTLCDWASMESERLAAKVIPDARVLSVSVIE
ncbi:MAG: heme-binding domain-containing protein [Acidobacteria bacterium]|nr:heme-binding domain-containing protein [Acidobacteriota bacterium]